MTGNNPRNYYIAAVFFFLFGIFLGWKTWTTYHAKENTIAAMLLFCTILCVIEILLLIRNGKRRSKGVPPRGKGKI